MSTSSAAAQGAVLVSDSGDVMWAWILAGLGIAAILIGLAFGYIYVKSKILGSKMHHYDLTNMEIID